MTTGLYPQEFIITFKQPITFRHLRFVTTNGKLKTDSYSLFVYHHSLNFFYNFS